MFRAVLFAPILLAAASPGAAATNLIVNGDFEQASGSDTVPAGWLLTRTGDPHVVLRLDGNFYANYGATGTPAQLDNHFLALGAYDSPIDRFLAEQTINTIAGETYDFSYDLAQFGGYTPVLSEITISDPYSYFAYDQEYSSPGTDLGSMFTTYRGSFVATASTMTIRLGSWGPTESNDTFFDNVVVTRADAAPAIPEPAAWTMMVGGFGLIGAAARRRAAQPTRA